MAVSELKGTAHTFEDVAELVREVHNCLHTVEGKVDKVATDVGNVQQRMSRVEGYQKGFAQRFNVQPPQSIPPPKFIEKHKTPLTAAVAALGAVTAFTAAYPFLRVVFLAIDAYLTKTPQ